MVIVPCILPADGVILGTKEEIVICSNCQVFIRHDTTVCVRVAPVHTQ